MKVVIDTNVVVSAAYAGGTPWAVVSYVVKRADVEWLVTPEILLEYRSVLSRERLGLTESMVKEWFELLDYSTTSILAERKYTLSRDPSDSMFLDCAAAAHADYLITGDRDFDAAPSLPGTLVVSPADFKRLVMGIS